MSSCSGSVRSFHEEDENLAVNEKIDSDDFDSASETSEAQSYQIPKSHYSNLLLVHLMRQIYGIAKPRFALLPSFSRPTQCKSQDTMDQGKLHPTAYLDGMRGLAAFAVFLCHLSYGTFDLTHVYNAGEDGIQSENTYFLQLPILRLIYSGPPMVAIFFVISGYVLSYKPLKQMRSQDYDALMLTLTSSTFRRALRLFLPCFVSTFIVACLAQLGFYGLTEEFANDMRMIHEDHAQIAPTALAQFGSWMHKMLDFVNVFDWSLYSGSIDLDRHLWTIPVEFRCSMVLFLTHMLVGRMRPRLRLATLSFLLVWGTYWNRWDMVPFWAGALLADLDLLKTSHQDLPSEKPIHEELGSKRKSVLAPMLNVSTFVLGLFLASYPDADGHISPGYVHLTNTIPERYTEKHRFWPTIGAVMIVWAVSNLSFLRRTIFESRAMQYLGKISFPLYVCHGFIIHTFGYMVMDWVWETTGGYEDWHRFRMGFAFSALCTVGMTIWVSDMFLRIVDVRCVKFARWLEGKVFVAT